MALDLTKDAPPVELNGVIEIGAEWDRSGPRSEWNHSCTSQCSNPCTVNRLSSPVVTARIPQQPGPQKPPPQTPKIPRQPGPGDRN